MYAALRSLLFALPTETSHRVALLAIAALGRLPRAAPRAESVSVFGLEFPNRVGLAAGLDKDAVAVAGFAQLGFGFVEIGTVTPKPQPGNPKPRLFRLVGQRAIINRMGFNSAGAKVVRRRLEVLRQRPLGVPVGVNIGKNKDTPNARAVDDYVAGVRTFFDVADYLTVNLSSPNTPGLVDLQASADAMPLLSALKNEQRVLTQSSGRKVPLLVKIAPDLGKQGIREIAAVVAEVGFDGVIATNTTVTRPTDFDPRTAAEPGGLSGAPLTKIALETVGTLHDALGGIPIIGVGGIMEAPDARAMIEAGAALVQIYTGFIYRGPALVREMVRELKRTLG